jgi:colanic acid/amylovoran biosynthesis glycosyltransferase
MLTIAYLANQFPSAVEPYVGDEIAELRRRGVHVLPGSVRRGCGPTGQEPSPQQAKQNSAGSLPVFGETISLFPLRGTIVIRALWLCLCRAARISDLLMRVMVQGSESPWRRFKALLHTGMGACYALRLKGRGVEHIHVRHGYFGSWIGMVAARLLGISFSITLHGSDLLRHGAYLDANSSIVVSA